jgi:hypothetical protein
MGDFHFGGPEMGLNASSVCDDNNSAEIQFCNQMCDPDGTKVVEQMGYKTLSYSCVPAMKCSWLNRDRCQAQLLCSSADGACKNKDTHTAICNKCIGRDGPGKCNNNTAVCTNCPNYCVTTKDKQSDVTWLIENECKTPAQAEKQDDQEGANCPSPV